MKIEQKENHDLEGAKRQRIPAVITWLCPECGEERETDLSEKYLSYPKWGEPMKLRVFCMDCDEVEPVETLMITPRVTVEPYP